MSKALYLNLKDNQLVLFADIIGFSNAVMENKNVTQDDKDDLIVNLHVIYNQFIEKYSSRRQEKMGIKFLWVSDSIIVTTPKENVNQLFSVLVDITNTLYCAGLLLRGAIALGKIYHEHNIWGPAFIRAVRIEANIAVYPRVLLQKGVYQILDIDPCYKDFIETSETPGYMQFNYFDCYITQMMSQGKDVTSNISIYGSFIRHYYNKAKRPDHLVKYVWLAEKLASAIKKHSGYIDGCLASRSKGVNILGKVVRITSHKQYLEYLEPIKLDRIMQTLHFPGTDSSSGSHWQR
ncbi:MAG TPA: hypothetical protein GXZ24_01100 [Firmicutes bacterium]|jgi:hypothetical protein|nr:hypothetical protein [Bacillota bacterium]